MRDEPPWDSSEGDVAQWCSPLTLQPEQSGGQGWRPGRAHFSLGVTLKYKS